MIEWMPVAEGGWVRSERGQTFELAALVERMGHALCALAAPGERRQHVLLRKEIVAVQPALAAALQPRCVHLGYCDLIANADGHCRLRPSRPAVGHGTARETAVP